MHPRSRRKSPGTLARAAGAAVALVARLAPAQTPPASPRPPVAVRPTQVPEAILGYDPARGVLTYVEHTPSPLAGFSHLALVEVPRDGAAPRHVRLTTDVDVAQVRGATDATRDAVRQAVEDRVTRDVAAARARLTPGVVLPVLARGATTGCQRAPYAPREFDLPGGTLGRVTVTPDGARASVALGTGGHSGAATEVPSVTVSSGASTVQAPYDVIADARELPGTDQLAVLLRSDACTPEGYPVPARAVFVAGAPPPEVPLPELTHAELTEAAVVAAVAPRARRRTVDGTAGFYDGRDRVVFDTAWALPPGGGGAGELLLVQYARRGAQLSPLLAEAGEAPASFALVERRGARLRVLSQMSPPVRESVIEGVGQEAYAADLDGDGRAEVLVRARHQHGDEAATLLRVADGSVQFVWRGVSGLDERATPVGTTAEVRHCDVGMDARTLVLRCRVEVFPAGAPPDAAPTRQGRLVQRVSWNGGLVTVGEERR